MNGENYNKSHSSLNNLAKKLGNFTVKEKVLNNKIREYIRNYNQMKVEIIKSIISKKVIYNRKKQFWNEKIKHLRMNEIHYKILLNSLIEEQKSLHIPKIDEKISNQINFLKKNIERLKKDINKLENKIKFEPLKIDHENEILERINRLKEKKKNLIDQIKEKNIEQVNLFENSKYFKTMKKVKFLKIYLDHIQRQLKKWSDKRKYSHLLVLNLYQKIKELSLNKKRLEKKFIEIEFSNNQYNQYFDEIMNTEKKSLRSKKLPSSREEGVISQATNPKIVKNVNNWLLLENYKRKKLAIALQKMNTGKKLDFYELKLILEHSKK